MMFSKLRVILAARPAAINLTQFNSMRIMTATRSSQMNSMYMQQTRSFSSQLNENEIIELVEGKVFEVLKSAAKCKHEKLARTATFEDLGFDSLDGVELVLAMEEHFGFDITNQEAEKIVSVMDAIQIFHSHVVKRQSLTAQDEDAE